MPELFAGKKQDFEDPGRKMLTGEDLDIGVFHVGGEFFAYENTCPHQGGPVCQGRMLKKVEEIIGKDKTSKGLTFSSEHTHLVCPWHGFEFNIKTGRHPGDRNSVLKPFQVRIDGDEIYVRV